MRSIAVVLTLAGMATLLACADRSREFLAEPSSSATRVATSDGAADEAKIANLINSLFPPKRQGELFKRFARVKAQVAAGRPHETQSAVVGFVVGALEDLRGGTLEDPNGSAPPSTVDAFRDLINAVATFGGFQAPIPTSNPLTGDGALAVVGGPGGTVITSSRSIGVQLPAGALHDSVIIVITRLPNGQTPREGPLPTDLDQYPPFVAISTSPVVVALDQPVTIGLCPLPVGSEFGPPNATVAGRLQLVHQDAVNPSTVELLMRREASFLQCADGVGGSTSSLGTFGTVDRSRLHFASVTAGELYTCALTIDGEAWCWGDNSFGQLGDGTSTGRLVPTRVATTLRFSRISANNGLTCVTTLDARAYCWGRNDTGQLGAGAGYVNGRVPVAVVGGHSFVDIGTGGDFACGLTASGEVWCWGYQPGASRMDGCGFMSQWPCSDTPQRRGQSIDTPGGGVESITFTSLSVGYQSVCGLASSGRAYCFGDANFGGFGAGWTPRVTLTPVLAANGMLLSKIYDGRVHECGLEASGKAWCWGLSAGGSLGDGSTGSVPNYATQVLPTAVLGDLRFADLALSDAMITQGTTCGITFGGEAYCWGGDAHEELGAAATDVCAIPGQGQFPCTPRPVRLESSERFSEISIGSMHACGVTLRHDVYCWGTNSDGQLGTGATNVEPVPTPIRLP